MNGSALVSLVKLFNSNKQVLNSFQAGNNSAIMQILKGIGISSPTINDINEAKDLAGAFDSNEDLNNIQTDNSSEYSTNKRRGISQYINNANNIMKMDPKKAAIYAALKIASNVARASGEIAENNSNRLAAAILAASRTNNSKQNELYGPSKIENAADAWGNEKQRRGTNAKIISKAVADTVDGLLGEYRAEDLAARQRSMAALDAELNLPGNYWQAASQLNKRTWQGVQGDK